MGKEEREKGARTERKAYGRDRRAGERILFVTCL